MRNTNLLIAYIYSISTITVTGQVTSVFICWLIVDDRKET